MVKFLFLPGNNLFLFVSIPIQTVGICLQKLIQWDLGVGLITIILKLFCWQFTGVLDTRK
jgi:hypothetical protein